MLCVTAPTYADPSKYELIRLPVPAVSAPTDVQIEVHAASINPVDVKLASGMLKAAVKDEYAIFAHRLLYTIANSICGMPAGRGSFNHLTSLWRSSLPLDEPRMPSHASISGFEQHVFRAGFHRNDWV